MIHTQQLSQEDRLSAVTTAISAAQEWLLDRQAPDGHWCAELEGDTILESEYLIYLHFIDRLDPTSLRKAANYIRSKLLPGGGVAIYPGGPMEISASVKAYLALKLAGDRPDAPHMTRTRDAILAAGGITKCNTWTKIYLAMVGLYPWDGCPAIPPEMMLLPKWFPFSIYNMSSWSRAMFVPLAIIRSKQPVKPMPAHAQLDELWIRGPGKDDIHLPWEPRTLTWHNFFLRVDTALKFLQRHHPLPFLHRLALRRAERWTIEHGRVPGGLGAIFPAMANYVLCLRVLGYTNDSYLVAHGIAEMEKLRIEDEDTLRLQPCFSPVWDTAIAINALHESGLPPDHPALVAATRWLLNKEVRRPGDWRVKHSECHRYTEPNKPVGAWFFEYDNEFYPDNDDTSMVLMALNRTQTPFDREKSAAIRRGIRWLLGMQCRDGGWAAFDKDNDKYIFTQVPFADHNAMIDPSTSDITARILECLSHFGFTREDECICRALNYLRRDQCPDGSWFGRWGTNYIYGTWQVLRGLGSIGADMRQPYVRRAVAWLKNVQNADGGWGETVHSYEDPHYKGIGESTASQTAWALMGLMSAGETHSPEVARGIEYLLRTQNADGTWDEPLFTGTGFPKVFYLRYHYYCHYWPLMALGMYARQVANHLPPVPRETEKSRALKQFYKQRRLFRAVARLRTLARI
ncbi:MAG: squalene--hopene cyclase [Verrucomicrobiae bacterium]|nr:squalene--hopene cyclase [Verrucomicrobiae bacterium]